VKYSDNLESANRRARPLKHLDAPKGRRTHMELPPGHSETLEEYLLNEWLPQLELDVEPTTYYSARTFVRNHIVPDLGRYKLEDLEPEVIRAFYRRLARKPAGNKSGVISRQSVISVHRHLHWALETLVHAERLPRNPAWGSSR
jgi:integrase